MHAKKLLIQTPCFANWDAMESDGIADHASSPVRGSTSTRFCGVCQKHVHDLSAMTRREAEALLAQARSKADSESQASEVSICVRYCRDVRGQVLFRQRVVAVQAPLHQRQGVQRLLAAAALAVSAFLTPQTALSDEASDIEEILWKQERAAAQALSPLGLDLEEESSAKDEDPFVPTAIPEPTPKHEPEMGKIVVY